MEPRELDDGEPKLDDGEPKPDDGEPKPDDGEPRLGAADARSAPDAGALLAAHGARLRLLLAHQTGRAVRARVELDDLLQEVYLRAWAARDDLPAEPAARARFLARIARNVVVDVARALRAAKRDGHAGPLERSAWSRAGIEPAARSPGPATRAALGEDVARVQAAFEGLAPEHRRVIGLRQLEGRSARETARRMGRSEAAVHSLYRRALEAWERAADAVFSGSADESAPNPRPDPA
jgi:RNA polymerase sigma-70 factor (ECF subfamily)